MYRFHQERRPCLESARATAGVLAPVKYHIWQGAIRAGFFLSNWSEQGIRDYIVINDFTLEPLCFAAYDPLNDRGGLFTVVDEERRMRFLPGDKIELKTVRFRILCCWPVKGAIESEAYELRSVSSSALAAFVAERQRRISDGEGGGSLEQKKREGYF